MDKISKQYTESKALSKVGKEKKSETSDQRLLKNTRFFKAAGTGLMLGMAGMVKVTCAESSNQVKELADRIAALQESSGGICAFSSANGASEEMVRSKRPALQSSAR